MREGANCKGQAACGEGVGNIGAELCNFHPHLRSAPVSERILHRTFANCFSWMFEGMLDPRAFTLSPRSFMESLNLKK